MSALCALHVSLKEAIGPTQHNHLSTRRLHDGCSGLGRLLKSWKPSLIRPCTRIAPNTFIAGFKRHENVTKIPLLIS